MADSPSPPGEQTAPTREERAGAPAESVATSPRAIPAILAMLLEQRSPTEGVLSAFVDTSPEQGIGQAYLIGFRGRAKAARDALPKDQRPGFDAAVDQAERVLTRQFSPGYPGLAIYASGDDRFVFAAPLPRRPAEAVRFAPEPVIAPLETAVDDFERVAILLFDKERARVFTIWLGEIEERHSLFDEVPGKQATGGWFALSQKRYERHHEDHVLRHAKRTIAALLDDLERAPFDRLFIGGPDEAIALLEEHLPRRLRSRVAGTLALELFVSDAEVLTAARAALEESERRHEAEALRTMLDGAGSARVTLGPDATLSALSSGRVHQLFVTSGSLGTARECPSCGLLTPGDDPCPRCGAATRAVADLRERAIVAALDSGARVEVVAGEGAALLAAHGGIAARARWA